MILLALRFTRRLGGVAALAAIVAALTSAWGVAQLRATDPIFLGRPVATFIEILSFRLRDDLISRTPAAVIVAQAAVWSAMALAAAAILLRLLRGWLQTVAARHARGHVVVCGVPSAIQPLLADLRRRGWLAVVVHPDREIARQMDLADTLCVTGDPADPGALVRASANRAAALVALGDDSVRNLAIGAALETVCRSETPSDSVRCILEIEDQALRQGLARVRPVAPGRRVDLQPFSRMRTATRLLLRDHPPDAFVDVEGEGRIRALILGTTPLALELLVEIAATAGTERSGPEIVVVGKGARSFGHRVADQFPRLNAVCRTEFHELDEDAPFACLANLLALATDVPISSVYACDPSTEDNLRWLTALGHAAARSAVRFPAVFVFSMDAETLFADADADSWGIPAEKFVVFGAPAQLVSTRFLLEERLDDLARAVHGHYLDEVERLQRPASPATVPWTQLAESYREACRRQADHLPTKARAIGFVIAASPAGFDSTLTPEEIEAVARLEHHRWMTERILQGWTYGSVRSDAARVHPALLPYEALTDELRELDRSVARNLPLVLARAGWAMRRNLLVAVVGTDMPASALGNLGEAVASEMKRRYPERSLVVLSPLLDPASIAVAGRLLDSHDARLHVPMLERVPGTATGSLLTDSRRRLIRRAERVFAPSVSPDARSLATWLVNRASELVAVLGPDSSPSDLTRECLAAASEQRRPSIRLRRDGRTQTWTVEHDAAQPGAGGDR